MATIEGLSRLKAKFRKLKEAASVPVLVQVGYTQRYAAAVHEVQAAHAEGKQWKYLSTPFRQMQNSGEINRIINQVFQKTGSLKEGVVGAGYEVLRRSQQIVPIDTSALKASGYIALEEDADRVAQAAFVKSEAIRVRELARRKQVAGKARLKKQAAAQKKAAKKAAKKTGRNKNLRYGRKRRRDR